MGFLFKLFGGELILKILWYTFFITFITGFIGLLVYLFGVVFTALITLYNSIQSLFDNISALGSNGDTVITQIYSLASCVGIIDGFNAGLPLILSAYFVVLNVYLAKYAVKFSLYFVNLIVALKPS